MFQDVPVFTKSENGLCFCYVHMQKHKQITDLREKLEHAKQLTSRHVYELDALTTVQVMTR